jgi:hypothetical protein
MRKLIYKLSKVLAALEVLKAIEDGRVCFTYHIEKIDQHLGNRDMDALIRYVRALPKM